MIQILTFDIIIIIIITFFFSVADPNIEKRDDLIFYVPRDESFSGIKTVQFGAKAIYSVLHSLIPTLTSAIVDPDRGFPYFTEIDKLFNEGVDLPQKSKTSLINVIPRLVKGVADTAQNILKFETPEAMDSKNPSNF